MPKMRKTVKMSQHQVVAANAISLPAEPGDIVLWDESNPQSVINMVKQVTQVKMKKALAEQPELFERDEQELLLTLRRNHCGPSPTDNRLRLKFWMEYDYAKENGLQQLDMSRVTSGVCSNEYFYNRYLNSTTKVAWMMCPPTSYMIKSEEALEFGIEQLRDILDQPHVYTDQSGRQKVDTQLASLKARIVATLDNRVRGAVVQKTMNVHVGTNNKDLVRAMATQSMENLTARLKALEVREKQLANGGILATERESNETSAEDKGSGVITDAEYTEAGGSEDGPS